jgi:two-component system, cell cycle response regulator DivK
MREKTVLLVEDNHDTRVIYATFLEALGLRVIEAVRAESALQLAKRHAPDLVLMDLQLPGISGLDAVRVLRSDPQTAAVPIIIVTASARGLTEEMRRAGCDELIAKPIDPVALGAAVTRRLAMLSA